MSDDNTDRDAALDGDGPARVRASDAERENALGALSAHYADGRLERVEFDQRADAALAARTRDQLLALFADLPGPKPVPSPADELADEPADKPTYEQTRARRTVAAAAANRLSVRPAAWWTAPLLLVPVLLAFAVLAALHGAPPFPLIAIAFILTRRHRRWHRWNREARPWI